IGSTGVDLSKILGWQTKILGEKAMKNDKCMVVSQLMGHVPGLPPNVYAYDIRERIWRLLNRTFGIGHFPQYISLSHCPSPCRFAMVYFAPSFITYPTVCYPFPSHAILRSLDAKSIPPISTPMQGLKKLHFLGYF